MGKVELDKEGQLLVHIESQADASALRAALRCQADPDPVDIPASTGDVCFDANHVANILGVWACAFEWTHPALARAVDELAPYAQQSSSLHSPSTLKSHQRWMQKMKERREGGQQKR